MNRLLKSIKVQNNDQMQLTDPVHLSKSCLSPATNFCSNIGVNQKNEICAKCFWNRKYSCE